MSDHPIDERYEVAAEVMALRAEIDTLRSEVRGLHETSNALHKDRDRLNAQALELCAELSGLRRENERLRQMNAALQDAFDTANEDTQAAAAERDRLREVGKRLAAEKFILRGLLREPPPHRFWGAGEPDCPRDIKGGNGELHTLRCKDCGEGPRTDVCQARIDTALSGTTVQPEPCTHLDGDGRSAFAPDLFHHGPAACLLCGATAPTLPAQPSVPTSEKCDCAEPVFRHRGYAVYCGYCDRDIPTNPTPPAQPEACPECGKPYVRVQTDYGFGEHADCKCLDVAADPTEAAS